MPRQPRPGGYGVVLLHVDLRKELSGGYRLTTNNRMELRAAIVALRALKKPCEVTLYSDSAYLVNQMRGHVPERWAANGWRNSQKKPVLNRDLWEELVAACGPHRVHWVRVDGHAGNPENERCDRLAQDAACRHDLPPDAGYEASNNPFDPTSGFRDDPGNILVRRSRRNQGSDQ